MPNQIAQQQNIKDLLVVELLLAIIEVGHMKKILNVWYSGHNNIDTTPGVQLYLSMSKY